jgi:mannose-6-phosphate isomerase-like protein (cupin superfamily)
MRPDYRARQRRREMAEAKSKAKSKPISRSAVSRSAVKTTAKKKPAARTVAKTTARKAVKSKARAVGSKPRRPRQRIAISHYREQDFQTSGLRAYAQYRDLGIAAATHGLAQVHVIRLLGPCNPKEVSKLHYHDVEFQMVYVLNGWVKTYMDGQGETLMQQGSSWTQPPRIKHLILDYSDNCELLEVILPAEFKTVELAE